LSIFELTVFRNPLTANQLQKIVDLETTKGNLKTESRQLNPSLFMTKPKTVLGIVYISGGSSWATAELTDKVTLEVIASRAAKNTKRSWKHLFKFPKEYICPVNLFDVSKAHGWNCEKVGEIMPILKSGKLGKKPCKFIKTINVVL